MKWKKPLNGTVRTKVKFIWFPKNICGVVRWLEFAEWEQRYFSGSAGHWHDSKWIEPPEKEDE